MAGRVVNDLADLGAFPRFDRELVGLHESQSRPRCGVLGFTIMGLNVFFKELWALVQTGTVVAAC